MTASVRRALEWLIERVWEHRDRDRRCSCREGNCAPDDLCDWCLDGQALEEARGVLAAWSQRSTPPPADAEGRLRAWLAERVPYYDEPMLADLDAVLAELGRLRAAPDPEAVRRLVAAAREAAGYLSRRANVYAPVASSGPEFRGLARRLAEAADAAAGGGLGPGRPAEGT